MGNDDMCVKICCTDVAAERTHLNRDICPRDTNEGTYNDRNCRHGRSDPPPLQSLHSALQVERVVEPEETGDAVRIPRRKDRGGDTSEIREDWDRTGQDKCYRNGGEAKEHPYRPAEDSMCVDVM